MSPATRSETGGTTLRVHYELAERDLDRARSLARAIALEQTVELPESCLTAELERRVVGKVESVEALCGQRSSAVVAYDTAEIGDSLLQVVNLLFGNVSLLRGVRVALVEWPESLLRAPYGPRLGIAGLRELCACADARPLVCAALKPLGLDAGDLASICRELALAGVDIIKDDHSLSDQKAAPFRDRVGRCMEAVDEANRETGGSAVYFPNLLGDPTTLAGQVGYCRASGCRGVLASPLLVGIDALRWISAEGSLAVMAHPSLTGAFFDGRHGIAPELLLGQLFRIAGADAVIYPNVGGRFPFTAETCDGINSRLREPLGGLRPAFPVPAGGIDVGHVSQWVERYGPDTIFLAGGSLYSKPDLRRAASELVAAVRVQRHE